MKFTQIPANTFQELVLNAGVLLDDFTVSTGTVGNLIGATRGGINFKATPTFKDFGEDIDNCPKNMMELKKIESWDITMSGTLLTVTASVAQKLIGAATVASEKITPRSDLATTDFDDLWWVGDYSDKNGATNGGYVAIHMMNTLSTGGFQIQSTDKEKGEFAFEFTAHFSNSAQDTVPFEVYVHAGTAE